MAGRLVIAAALVLAGFGAAQAQVVDIEGRYWFADLDAATRVESDSGSSRLRPHALSRTSAGGHDAPACPRSSSSRR
jgi:hypothetical protein